VAGSEVQVVTDSILNTSMNMLKDEDHPVLASELG